MKFSKLLLAFLIFVSTTSLAFAENLKTLMSNAEAGNMIAQYNLGQAYENGTGVDINYSSAANWYNLSAQQGYADAQYKLGSLYIKGLGVDRNPTLALKWHHESALQGHVEGQLSMGIIHLYPGQLQDSEEATKWFTLVAEQGDSRGYYNIGEMYFKGMSVPKNDSEAFIWYEKSAAKGRAEGQRQVGLMLLLGTGVPEDKLKGKKWLSKAAIQGDQKAIKILSLLEKQ